MTLRILAYFFFFTCFNAAIYGETYLDASKKNRVKLENDGTIIETKRILIKGYPEAFNPSIIQTQEGFLLIFRHIPNFAVKPWVSYIGVALLNDKFEFLSEPQILNPRSEDHPIPPQSEDARIFSCAGKLYLIYNDNDEIEIPTPERRRDMFIAELKCENKQFALSTPIKLMHASKYQKQLWQKNWTPFVWNDTLFLIYSIDPHEILAPDFATGLCRTFSETHTPLEWSWGRLRGGTPALLVDGEYLSFFHSSLEVFSPCSNGKKLWHYFMGAYTFSAEPPFEVKKMTTAPIVANSFYFPSNFHKRVVFPGGFVVVGNFISLVYGKDDGEVWIATLDKNKLQEKLIPVK